MIDAIYLRENLRAISDGTWYNVCGNLILYVNTRITLSRPSSMFMGSIILCLIIIWDKADIHIAYQYLKILIWWLLGNCEWSLTSDINPLSTSFLSKQTNRMINTCPCIWITVGVDVIWDMQVIVFSMSYSPHNRDIGSRLGWALGV